MTKYPVTALDLVQFSESDKQEIFAQIAAKRLTGEWDTPIHTSGDFATMTRLDLIYWLYKAQSPVRHAAVGSGLESFFAAQRPPSLPAGFRPERHISMVSAGDLMDHHDVPNSADVLYAQVAELLFGADITTANLECIVFPSYQNLRFLTTEAPPLIFQPKSFEVVTGVDRRKFSFVSTACNHSLDCGEAGVTATQDHLDAAGIAYHGTFRDEASCRRATIVEANGIRLGMIAHTFGLNAKRPPPDKPWIVSHTNLNAEVSAIDFRQILEQIRWCKEQQVDLIVGHLHWGFEHEFYPRPTQLEVAHYLAEQGLDLIVGNHTHVVQPVEYYRTVRDPERVVPIYYALGNLINPFSMTEFCLGGVAKLSLSKGICADGKTRTYVAEAGLSFVFQQHDIQNATIQLVPASKEQRSLLPWTT